MIFFYNFWQVDGFDFKNEPQISLFLLCFLKFQNFSINRQKKKISFIFIIYES